MKNKMEMLTVAATYYLLVLLGHCLLATGTTMAQQLHEMSPTVSGLREKDSSAGHTRPLEFDVSQNHQKIHANLNHQEPTVTRVHFIEPSRTVASTTNSSATTNPLNVYSDSLPPNYQLPPPTITTKTDVSYDDTITLPVDNADSRTGAAGTSTGSIQAPVEMFQQHKNVDPFLIYSIRNEIKAYDLSNFLKIRNNNQRHSNNIASYQETQHSEFKDTQLATSVARNSRTLIAGLKNTIALDFYFSHTSDSYLFWTDVIEERIYRGTISDGSITNVEMIVKNALSTAEGLAVDWVARNIYWVESNLDHIEVATMNGTSRRTLISGGLDSPRAIALDPRVGYMFWTDWDKRNPRIERATMSGENRRWIITIKDLDGGWPNGLTLDYEDKMVYWIDASSDSIHAVDYEGSNHRQILTKVKSLGHPFSITLLDDRLYWTDWKTNSISTTNKYTGSSTEEIQKLSNRLFDIKVFHPSRQPEVADRDNPCHINNGNCSNLCLLSAPGIRRCLCPHLMKLDKDQLNCITNERVLLIGRTNEIRAVDIEEPLHHTMSPISVPRVYSPKQFEFDVKSRNVFWLETTTGEVKRVQLGGPNNIETILDVSIDYSSGLALDWISGNIYVASVSTNKTSGKIFISNLNGEFISVLMDSSHDLVSPNTLSIHPELGLLFCIDETSNSDPIIFQAKMDGSDKHTIISKTNFPSLLNPSGLTIDYQSNGVYWINQATLSTRLSTIEYYDLKTKRITTILDDSEDQIYQISDIIRVNPGMLCIDRDHLIVGGAHSRSEVIVRINKNATNQREVLTNTLDQLSSLKVFDMLSQNGTNACTLNNGNCSQLCIPTSPVDRVCKCTMGYLINPSNQTECIGRDLFLVYSYNFGMKGISIDPRAPSDDYYLPLIHKAFRASSIDYIYRNNQIYWVDNEEGSITKINRDTTKYQVIVQGLESEESIGIDWVAGNLYWLDPYYDVIEVARLNGSSRYTIVHGDMDKANGIVVNPLKGYIAWSDIGSYPKIETARLDGSERKIIVNSSLMHIDDLAIDYMDDFIYWLDSTTSRVERIKPDGSGRQLVGENAPQVNYHLVSIAIHEHYLFAADSRNQGTLIRFGKNDMSNQTLIHHPLGEGIRDMTVYAKQPIPSHEINPCAKDNGGCQDLCIFTGTKGGKRCICSHGRLDPNNLSCQPYDNFVLYSKLSQIESLHMENESPNNSPYPPIVIGNKSNIISLAVDYKARRVIYSEIMNDQICSIGFNGTDHKVLVVEQSLVEGITFANNQLFWTSIRDNSISRYNISSTGIRSMNCKKSSCSYATVEKIVKLSSDDKPRGIALDRCTNYIYWTNWNTNAPSIQRASPHNGYKIESIITTDIKVPNGIAIDQEERELYWCDAKLDKIESCDLDGSRRKVLISASPQHPFALAIWDNSIFWTDWLARGVFKADKFTGNDPLQLKKVSQRPMGIAIAAQDSIECPVDLCTQSDGSNCGPGMECVKQGKRLFCQPTLQPQRSHLLLAPSLMHKTSKMGDPNYDQEIILKRFDRFNFKIPDNQVVTVGPEAKQVDSTTPIPSTKSSTSSTTLEALKINSSTPSSLTTTKVIMTTNASIQAYSSTTFKPIAFEKTTLSVPTQTNQTIQNKSSSTTTLQPCQIVPAALHTTTDATSYEECKPNQFKCYLSEKLICIQDRKECDGHFDCPNKEDESACFLSKRATYTLKHETNWHRYVTVIFIIFGAAVAALFLVFGTRGRRRWFVNNNGTFNHRRMFDDGTNIEISNPMFDEDDSGNLVHCAFSIDLNERTTNFSNPLYERQVLLMNDKPVTSS